METEEKTNTILETQNKDFSFSVFHLEEKMFPKFNSSCNTAFHSTNNYFD